MARLAKGQDFSVYSSPNFKYWFDEKYYTVQGAETMARLGTKDDLSTMRAEYTRMRDVAQKRIKRLGKQFPESKAYQTHKQGFAKLKELDPRDFPKAFAELAKFVKAKTSSVTGQREAQRKTTAQLNKAVGAGSDDGSGKIQASVTKENYWRVIKILEEARKQKATYGSDKIVTLAESTLSLSEKQFDTMMDNLEKSLQHADNYTESIDSYMKNNKIEDYQKVDMDEFIKQMGW